MGEEILPPTSPNLLQSPIRSRRKNIRGETGQENTPPRNRRFSVQKPPKRDSAWKEEKGQNKSRWPGLNVVTNFSKPPVLAHRAAEADLRNHVRRKEPKPSNPRLESVTLSKTKALEDLKTHKRNRSSGEQIMKSEGELKFRVERDKAREKDLPAGLGLEPFVDSLDSSSHLFVDGKSRVHSLRRSSTKITELSPSDAPIMIGISIPSAKLAEHSISPDAGPVGLSAHRYPSERDAPGTPTIIVTPAKDGEPWSSDSYQVRRAAVSSIYSQAFQHGRGVAQPRDIPPLPVPSQTSFPSKYNPPTNPFDDETGNVSPSRIVSSCTVFDEDEIRGRPDSGESQLRILKRTSTDTIATRHRSEGWWNHILSPFATRANTMMLKVGTSEAGSPVPALPTPTTGGLLHRGLVVKEANRDSPSPMSDPEERVNHHSSIWTDISKLEVEGRDIHRAFEQISSPRTPGSDHTGEVGKVSALNTPLPFEGFGAAAEYYNACWHDQNSPTPYFKCQNHSCGPSTTDQRIILEAEDDGDSFKGIVEDPAAKRDLSEPEQNAEAHGFHQAPANRFSAAFSQAAQSRPKTRPLSDVTDIEDLDATPEVHEAHMAPIVRVGAPIPAAQPPASDAAPRAQLPDATIVNPPKTEEISPSQILSKQLPAYSPSGSQKPPKRSVAVMHPAERSLTPEQPNAEISSLFKPPVEDGPQQEKVPVVDATREDQTQRPQNTYIINHYYDDSNGRVQREEVALADFEPPPRAERSTKGISRTKREKDNYHHREQKPRKGLRYGNCFKREKPMTKKKKGLLLGVAISLLILIILILALTMTLTRKGDQMHVQTQWLNITGFPPIPTGISTIIQPDAVQESSACVQPATVWSCAVPKEEQQSVAPNDPDQPNFRVEIRFRNGTSANGTASSATRLIKRSLTPNNPASAGNFVRRHIIQIRDSFSNSLFSPSPSPPSEEDQVFLGNTTDKNALPFDGETTPFFMSFLSSSKIPSAQRLMKRVDKNTSDPFPDLTKAIPPPETNPDGTAASANLLPFPAAQPLRLYDRGLTTEHYGFYTYYDRSIFLKSTALLNDSSPSVGDVPDDQEGGALEAAAAVRCTWAQTRFLVQIWTNQGAAALLGNSTAAKFKQQQQSKNLTESSANDFSRPGSFPYPVTITLDRHGGDVSKKLIYCYGLDNREHILPERKKVQLEDRGAGGALVNPAQGPFATTKVGKNDGGPGGVDGGSGGCGCRWKNFEGGV